VHTDEVAGSLRRADGSRQSGPASTGPPADIAIEAIGITKAFGATLALDNVDFQAVRGEVSVLMGENGAGKSTLMKILAGEIAPDSGAISLGGERVRFRSPREARRHGVALIHQELSLFPALRVADNIFAGMEHGRVGLIDNRRHATLARDILERLDRRIDPAARADSLAVGQQQIVEIAKALAVDARVVIMDEPTSALSNTEVDSLFDIIRDLKSRRVAIIYISHRMDEIFRIADSLVVFRDGRRVASAAARAVDLNWISDNMLGSKQRASLQRVASTHIPMQGQTRAALEVEGVSVASASSERLLLENVSLSLKAGEILGVYGLLGAGKTELAEAIAGLRPDATGACRIDGRIVEADPTARIAAGVAFVPEDRQRQALIPTASVSHNISLSCLRSIATANVVSARRERSVVNGIIKALSIKASAPSASIQSLSGGNQQKAVIARALLTQPKALVLDEPTRGVDVGAKAEIFELMRKQAAAGIGILFCSSELPEILAVADRVLVLSRGRACGLYSGPGIKESDVVKASFDAPAD
jgi:erythritol transport system ATP-binding protein